MWAHRISKFFKVGAFNELHDALSNLSAGLEGIGRVFRGHSDAAWKLVPKAGRAPYDGANLAVYFEEWKRYALTYLPIRPENEWEWLAVAQHHGLATNLLDWTYNPLAAAFFAVSEEVDCDAAIFSYRPSTLMWTDFFKPLAFNGIAVYKPFHLAQRITRQMGIFTVHGPATLALDEFGAEAEKLEIILIDRAYRKRLLFDLAAYGINHGSLFPDLDGLSRHMNWKMLNDVFDHTL